MNKKLSLFFSALICISLSSGYISGQTVDQIVDRCIKRHGGKSYQDAHYSFRFRKHTYNFKYKKGEFVYERIHPETKTLDRLTNDGFERFIDGEMTELSEKDQGKYARSVNSVHYFAFLPFFLNDPAVRKKLLGTSTIDGHNYYEVKVTFVEEGGGDDFDDEFVYWISQENWTMDYLAYSFHVDGGGVRFRKAYNPRKVKGVRFQDYVNYKHDKDTPVESLDDHYLKGTLKELSRIELTDIKSLK